MLNENEVKTVRFSESMYGTNGERQIIKDGIRMYVYARDHSPALLDTLTMKSGITVSKIDEHINQEAMEVSKISHNHSGASWSAVCWAAVQLAQGYTIVGDWGTSDDLLENVYINESIAEDIVQEVEDPNTVKKYRFSINHGSSRDANFVDDPVLYDREYDAHIALIDALNSIHSGKWTVNGHEEIVEAEDLGTLLDSYLPSQYTFVNGSAGSYIAGYVQAVKA
jgi:hypothetical protein